MLSFDVESHRYAWNGQPVPGVTEVIRAALGDPFARINRATLERKRQIGNAAHKACELDDAGKLDQATVHPAVAPYLEAWRKFRRESRCEIVLSECQLYQPDYGYAGTADVFASVNGDAAVIDIKTGAPGPQAAIQTAAYAGLCAELAPRRFALRALPTGKYKFEEYTNPGDWRDFLACLAVYRLKERIANE